MITLSALARAAGVSTMTVSRALRNHREVSASTRKAIVAMAAEMGYRPDPLISIFQSNLRRRKVPAFQATIAYLETVRTENEWDAYTAFRRIYAGATAHAQSLGYHIERFWLHEKEMTPEKMMRIFRARSIQGLILHHLPDSGHVDDPLQFPFSDLAIAALGTPLPSNSLHYADTDSFGNLLNAWNKLLASGYQKIGVILDKYNDARSQHRQVACFTYLQQHSSPNNRVPLYLYGRQERDTCLAWYSKHRPEVIINAGEQLPKSLQTEWFQKVGTPVAYLDFCGSEGQKMGIDQELETLGAAVVDLILGQFNRGERGIPEHPKTLLISGKWRE